MFLKFQDRYTTSTAITAWLGSLATALRLLLGKYELKNIRSIYLPLFTTQVTIPTREGIIF